MIKVARFPLGPALVLVALLAPTLPAGAATPLQEPVADEVVVVESSILLHRAERARPENLAVAVDGALGEAVAVYPLAEVEIPTTLHFDLCTTEFSRLLHAVGMVAAVADVLVERGPVTVLETGQTTRTALAPSRDAESLAAALSTVLRSPLGGCDDAAPGAAIARLRAALAPAARPSSAPALLVLYGLNHRNLSADELRGHRPAFDDLGRELAGAGYTTVVLLPDEDDEALEEREVEPLLGDPDGPPRAVDLGAIAGVLAARRRVVPDDPRILMLATDPRNDLARELVAPGRGRLFAFPRPFEAFVVGLSDYQVLYYRSRLREAERRDQLAPIEVRLRRSGQVVETARFIRLGRPSARP